MDLFVSSLKSLTHSLTQSLSHFHRGEEQGRRLNNCKNRIIISQSLLIQVSHHSHFGLCISGEITWLSSQTTVPSFQIRKPDHAAMTESSAQTHAEGEKDSEEAVPSHDNCSCLLRNNIHLPLLRWSTTGQINLKNVCYPGNVCLCLNIRVLFTLKADIGTLQKPLPVS